MFGKIKIEIPFTRRNKNGIRKMKKIFNKEFKKNYKERYNYTEEELKKLDKERKEILKYILTKKEND
jgi:uncharacterized membrane protein (DUF106 family)